MRIVVIDTYGEANGGTITTVRLVEELKTRGHDVVVVTTGRHEEEGFYLVPGFAPPGVKESVEKMQFLFGRGCKDVYRKAFEGADLVQIQFPFMMPRNAVKVASRMGIPVIGACHVQPQNIISAMGKESPLREKVLFVLMNVRRHAMEKRRQLLVESVRRSKYKEPLQLILCGLPCLIGDSPNSAASMFAHDELSDPRKETLFMAERCRFDRCVDHMEESYADIVSTASGKTLDLGTCSPEESDERAA